MKPEEALQLVDSVLMKINGTREDHIRLQQAVQVLSEAIKQKKAEK